MRLDRRPAPHIRYQESNKTLMGDVIILLTVLSALAYLFYGMRALAVCGATVLAAVISDTACVLIRGRRPNPRDFSPIVTGMIIALTMPATISYYIVVLAAVFAIVVVKHPFGGTGSNIFNPAAAGFSFAAICWPEQVFMYPMPFDRLAVFGQVADKVAVFQYGETAVNLSQNPAIVLKLGGIPAYDLTDMLLGNYPGPMGATNILVIIACLGYLLFRRTVRWQLPIPFLATCALLAFLLPRANTGGVQSVLFEMMSGALLFSAVFIITDPVTSPKRDSSLAIHGVFAGIVTMLFRWFGGYEESIFFAILLSNAFVPVIDRLNESLHRVIRRKQREVRRIKNAQKA